MMRKFLLETRSMHQLVIWPPTRNSSKVSPSKCCIIKTQIKWAIAPPTGNYWAYVVWLEMLHHSGNHQINGGSNDWHRHNFKIIAMCIENLWKSFCLNKMFCHLFSQHKHWKKKMFSMSSKKTKKQNKESFP